MLLTIALVVLCSAIVVFFSQEFSEAIKKFFKIPGMKLFLPIALASFLAAYYELWVLWALLKLKAVLYVLTEGIQAILPFDTADWLVAQILLLFALTIIPVVLIDLWSVKKTYERFKRPYLLSTVIWIVAAFALVMELPAV
ncbi:hypothetical protein Lrub_0948 [Legionella rubrilucens]|uniref:Uncharacterized protein n=1 Tax=Legionella rubrilucens TaxID=458 RepID=A0A0W0XVE1_9GAMM|nr:hypothetical protein [Legionella rubrilucens]KTD48597.1 hypothetical protein Lrub_0948 [Legionella rubrilucens]